MESPLVSHLDMVTQPQKSQKGEKVRVPKGYRKIVKKLHGIPEEFMIHGQRLDQFCAAGTAVPRKRRERIVLLRSRAEEADSGFPRHSLPEANPVPVQDVVPSPISSQGGQHQLTGQGADAIYPDDLQNPFPFNYFPHNVHSSLPEHLSEDQTPRSLSFVSQPPIPPQAVVPDDAHTLFNRELQCYNTDLNYSATSPAYLIDVHDPTDYDRQSSQDTTAVNSPQPVATAAPKAVAILSTMYALHPEVEALNQVFFQGDLM